MDLNELLSNHRRASLNAREERPRGNRQTCFDLVGYYAKRIHRYRDRLGIPRHTWSEHPGSLRSWDE